MAFGAVLSLVVEDVVVENLTAPHPGPLDLRQPNLVGHLYPLRANRGQRRINNVLRLVTGQVVGGVRTHRAGQLAASKAVRADRHPLVGSAT